MSSSESEFPTIFIDITSNHTRFYAEWGNFCLREYLNNKWMFNVNTENWKICKLCLPWCWPGECCSRCSRCCPSPSPRGCTRPWRPAAPSAACTAASSPLNPGWRWTPSWKCKMIKSLQDHRSQLQNTRYIVSLGLISCCSYQNHCPLFPLQRRAETWWVIQQIEFCDIEENINQSVQCTNLWLRPPQWTKREVYLVETIMPGCLLCVVMNNVIFSGQHFLKVFGLYISHWPRH